ncbi:MAG: DUF6364 family protein [Bacteroidota bacterium]|nr:DUF6364 family protein [Bacteroidota bacterium]
METKLTIRLKKEVIERAKDYAQNHKISLSKMVEAYLESLTEQKKDEIEITPLVESLSGVIHLAEDFYFKEDHTNYLIKKYE